MSADFPKFLLQTGQGGGKCTPDGMMSSGVVFMLLMGATAFLAARLLRKGGAIMCFVLEGRGGSWLAHLHFLWFPLAVGIPLALALTSALGYHHTALHLERLLQMTLWLFIGLFLLKELLVPNKQFITGKLINWTLSNKMNRIVITIGVAYRSDVDRALELMIEAAVENEQVLADPKPVTSFEGFGDNALTLLLRCYLETLDYRLATISALHQAINRKFNEAGIAIAFPQRDMHLDTVKPLEIHINRSRGGGQASPT